MRLVAERTVRGHTTRAVRHCITNLPVDTGAARIADLVRGHWGVENSLHWVLDDTFQEDRCRLRTGQAACNMAGLRRIALNILTLLKQYFWPKLSIRRLPGWWPETPPGWSRSWPCDDFVNALDRLVGDSTAPGPLAGPVPVRVAGGSNSQHDLSLQC